MLHFYFKIMENKVLTDYKFFKIVFLRYIVINIQKDLKGNVKYNK